MEFEFKFYPNEKPLVDGKYFCRAINSEGKFIYRVDEWKNNITKFEDMMGFESGFQKDVGDSYKTNGFIEFKDGSWDNNIISFKPDKRTDSVPISSYVTLYFTLSELKEIDLTDLSSYRDYIRNYQKFYYEIIIKKVDKMLNAITNNEIKMLNNGITAIQKIIINYNRTNGKVFVEIPENIFIDSSQNEVLKEYYQNYFEYNIEELFKEEVKKYGKK